MEPEMFLILIATIIMGTSMCGVIFWFHKKFKNEVREKEKALAAYKLGFSRTLQFGENQAMGKIAEQVADFSKGVVICSTFAISFSHCSYNSVTGCFLIISFILAII